MVFDWHALGQLYSPLSWFCIVISAFFAGLVRGFSGFGTALVFIPIATTWMSPVAAITAISVFELFAPLPILRSLVADRTPNALRYLIGGLLICLPVGLFLLLYLPQETFRTLAAIVALIMVVLLWSGWQGHFEHNNQSRLLVGSGTGLIGGLSGIPGPIPVFYYLGSVATTRQTRADIMLLLLSYDVIALIFLLLISAISISQILTGLVLIPAAMLGGVIGAWLFNPDKEKVFRSVAIGLITLAALQALPWAKLFGWLM